MSIYHCNQQLLHQILPYTTAAITPQTKNSKPANMESKRDCSESDDISDSDLGESDNVSYSKFNVDCVENSSVSCHRCVKPYMFSMLCVVLSLYYHLDVVGGIGKQLGRLMQGIVFLNLLQ